MAVKPKPKPKPAAKPAPAPPASPAAAPTDPVMVAYQQYGYLGPFLDDPVIGPILRASAAANEDQNHLLGRIYGNAAAKAWYESTSASSRTFDANLKLAPATVKQQVDNQKADLAKQGLSIPDDRLTQIATDSLRFGWNASRTQSALAAEFHFNPKSSVGNAAGITNRLKAMAADYMVPMSDQTLGTWIQGVLAGTQTEDSFQSYLGEQAKSLFPSMASAIDAGISPHTYTAPYREIAAKELEIPPNSVDLTTPRFSQAIQQVDPKTGDRTSMNLADFTTYVRQLPEWKQTKGAQDMASAFSEKLLNTFGQVAS